jgi:TolB-like protein
MQTLVFLAEHQQEVITRQQFHDAVWQGRVVNEEALSRAISLLRTALEDDRQNPTFIQTVPGKGYRLIAEPTLIAARPTADSRDNSIAVLPFLNLSDDPANEYFSDGMAEEILNSLAQVPDFKVVARTSSFAFKGQNEDLREIGRKLDVSHLLEGSVRKAGNTVRVTAQLISTDDGFHLWSETYDRGLDNIFSVQDEIADAVVDNLKVHILGHVMRKQEIDPEVYSLYLQALHFLKPGQNERLKRALELFQRVTELDPNYPPAWVGIADTCWHLISHDAIDKPWAMEVAEDACNRALELDDNYAEAQLCRSLLSINYSENWELAKSAMDKAHHLAPGIARVSLQAGNLAASMGELEQAHELLDKALSLDPLNTTCHIWLANALIALERYDEAVVIIDQGLEINPDRSVLHNIRARIHFLQGDLDAGQREAELEPENFWREYALILSACYNNKEREARLKAFAEIYHESAPFQLAELYGVCGDIDEVFRWLNIAIDIKDSGITEMFTSPFLREVRTDDRWRQLVRRRGL